jgi:hypothetical protein
MLTIIADKLSAGGWSWGYCSTVARDGWRWFVDARSLPCVFLGKLL